MRARLLFASPYPSGGASFRTTCSLKVIWSDFLVPLCGKRGETLRTRAAHLRRFGWAD
nr:MAG TPA: hypothetical protein [Caudoviricetes sp.]